MLSGMASEFTSLLPLKDVSETNQSSIFSIFMTKNFGKKFRSHCSDEYHEFSAFSKDGYVIVT